MHTSIFRNTVAACTAVLFFSFLLAGCKDPIIKDGSLTSNPDDLLNIASTDTFTVFSKTEIELPYSTSGVTTGLLGSMDDPIFGKTTCGFYAQYRLFKAAIDRGANPVLDSAVLSIVYEDKYGSNSKPVSIAVYEMIEDMDVLRSYNTNESFSVNGAPLGVVSNLIPNTTDSVNVLGRNLAPQLRIRLNQSFGNKIFNADSLTLSNNDPQFLSFLKGLYVTALGNGNGITYVNLLATKIIFHYHNSVNDSLVYEVGISNSSAKMNSFVHTGFSRATAAAQSSLASDSILYAQSGAGTRIKLTIPFLNNLPSNLAINKAELIITKWEDTQYGSDSIFPVPSILLLRQINASGGVGNLANTTIERGGGAVSKTVIDNGKTLTKYSFNISQYLQSVIKNPALNNGFYITTTGVSRADRVVLANFVGDKSFKIILKITYSKSS